VWRREAIPSRRSAKLERPTHRKVGAKRLGYPGAHVIGRGLLRRRSRPEVGTTPRKLVATSLATMEKGGCVYIITNAHHTTLYVGVTSNLYTRIVQHREKEFARSFSARYNLYKLVYYEPFHTIKEAIGRERQLKAGSRKKKEKLINDFNPGWKDLFEEIRYW